MYKQQLCIRVAVFMETFGLKKNKKCGITLTQKTYGDKIITMAVECAFGEVHLQSLTLYRGKNAASESSDSDKTHFNI